MKYRRFLAMIATSAAVMFGLMYLNTYALDHVLFSETRLWMAFVMGAAMAVVMLSFMLGMYTDRRKNILIYVGSALVFAAALFLVRSQQTVGDVAFMSAMIPHHSIAIMTSERSRIRDPRTHHLARAIIEAQRREIAEMKYLISQIEENGPRPAPENEGDVANLPVPQTMTDADLGTISGLDGGCLFRFTEAGRPMLAYGSQAVLKLNDELVRVPIAGDGRYTGDGIDVTVRPLRDEGAEGGPSIAELVLRVAGAPHEVGYHGFSQCDRQPM